MHIKELKKFLEKYDFKKSLILSGSQGIGKTKEMIELFNSIKVPEELEGKEFMQKYWINDFMFKKKIQSGDMNLRPAEQRTAGVKLDEYPLEVMLRCKILFYDDLGVSDATEAYIRDLTGILDERLNKKLVTIISTNLDGKELASKLNVRIYDRLSMNTTVLILEGESYRQKSLEVIK